MEVTNASGGRSSVPEVNTEGKAVVRCQHKAGSGGVAHSPLLVFSLLAAIVLGLSIGYLASGRPRVNPALSSEQLSVLDAEMTAAGLGLPEEYALQVSFGSIGAQLLGAGTIDYDSFVELYRQSGRPLSISQMAILSEGSDEKVVINRDNAYFLLNLFWALGLTNENPLLEEGQMTAYGEENIGRFASTGGWTLGTKTPVDLFSSTPILILTTEQQARLEEVAAGVYRPCCDNPTSFPDCNHGMAMLGLLELMAAENATVEEMFVAAKNVNAFWFPRQTAEVAMFFRHAQGQDFTQADAREFVGFSAYSASGFRGVRQWLADNSLLEATPGSGSRCGV